jgi:hypothetical protein
MVSKSVFFIGLVVLLVKTTFFYPKGVLSLPITHDKTTLVISFSFLPSF